MAAVRKTVLLELAQQARAAGEDTFTYGLMYQRQACQAAKIEEALPRFESVELRDYGLPGSACPA
jgi:hypothetical protein